MTTRSRTFLNTRPPDEQVQRAIRPLEHAPLEDCPPAGVLGAVDAGGRAGCRRLLAHVEATIHSVDGLAEPWWVLDQVIAVAGGMIRAQGPGARTGRVACEGEGSEVSKCIGRDRKVCI